MKRPKRRGGNPRSSRPDAAQTSAAVRADARRTPPVAWYRSTLFLSALSAVLMYGSFPPLNLWPLAWIAPLGWLTLLQRRELTGRRPYLVIWATGTAYWLCLLRGISLAHWLLPIGWLFLSGYLAIYLVIFVALGRVAIHRIGVPLPLVAPVIWVGLELARGYVITGFSAALLGHSQVAWIELIQIADLAGGYAVSFLIVFCASCILIVFRRRSTSEPHGWWSRAWLPTALIVLGVVLAYGRLQVRQLPDTDEGDPLRVALIQNSVDTIFEYDRRRNSRNFDKYLEQTLSVAAAHPDLHLIVWPESAFTENSPQILRKEIVHVPDDPEVDAAEFEDLLNANIEAYKERLKYFASGINRDIDGRTRHAWLLVGTESRVFGPHPAKRFNTALLLDPQGQVVDQYFKNHRVLFGEYLPFGDLMPWLYRVTPLKEGLTAGDDVRSFEVQGVRLAPNICFESTVPHLVRNQNTLLSERGEAPGVLVNLTNDGWFWGSAILDLHLACNVFRAIENSKPVLVAANTGISAVIDQNGRVLQRAPKRAVATLVADVQPDYSKTVYQQIGDVFALLCLMLTVGLSLWTTAQRRIKASHCQE